MAQSKLGLFLSRTKKDPGRLKPGLSVTPCHRLCAQGRKKALQQTISRVYLIRRMVARSYEKKAPPWRERGKVLLTQAIFKASNRLPICFVAAISFALSRPSSR